VHSDKVDLSGPAAVILGAGASRAEAEASHRGGVLPPLDTDFFEQLQKLKSPSIGRTQTLRLARELFGSSTAMAMESYFIGIEFLADAVSVLKSYEVGTATLGLPCYIADAPKAFRSALLGVLREAGIATGRDEQMALSPERHRALVRILECGDSIISFNYDLLIDRALKEEGSGKWNAVDGYPCRCSGVEDSAAYWQPRGADRPIQDSIALLKPHGSLNWTPVPEDCPASGISLTEPPFDPDKMLVLPPAWVKPINYFPLREVWAQAWGFLSRSKVLIVAGYSLPQTDMWAQALLRAAAMARAQGGRSFANIIVANPDDSVCAKVVSVVGAAVGADTRVRRFRCFEELVDYLA
jgi:hypothetical protein